MPPARTLLRINDDTSANHKLETFSSKPVTPDTTVREHSHEHYSSLRAFSPGVGNTRGLEFFMPQEYVWSDLPSVGRPGESTVRGG